MSPGWQTARHILCVRLDNMGDVLMTTPAIRALKQGAPGRRITLLASPAGAAVARHIPEIDHTIAFEAPWMKGGEATVNPAQDEAVRAQLAAGGFDAAVIFTVYSQNPQPAAYFCYLAGIPLRLAHCRENPYHLLSDWVPEREPEHGIRHEVQRQLDLVAQVGCHTRDQHLSFQVRDEACNRVRRLLLAQGLDEARPWVLVHSGATAPSRRYPPAQFAEAIRLLARSGCQAVLTGSAAELDDVAQLQQQAGVPTLSLAGRIDLAELGAAIRLADVVLSNNSGPAHLAAAIGTPLVDLYALTNPQHTPWLVRHALLFHDVPCKYCYKSVCPQGHHACLRQVSPAQVADAVLALLPDTRRNVRPPHRAATPRPPARPRSGGATVIPLWRTPCVDSGS
ncbi:glycosyltransferase family 9 protein [Chitiniphilus purpureus]|uniref:Glycosyltransferase family 9 protein n=1 Tax=Chitiniphilus purpureus TaxID=2981137 RepID=A0ABY6DPI7_9NEIS|nr:glycosyltransferase family 9 protein [Chitiniphilus sp. CD1]UXY16300.1 glycosyltransferase family 9 protein [Chitiniphilus sp. CD1]